MSADFSAARTTMVDSQVRTQDVTDLAIQDAMRQVPREAFVPAGKAWLAYADADAFADALVKDTPARPPEQERIVAVNRRGASSTLA